MDSRLQLRVQRYGWDAAAQVYEDEWRHLLEPVHEALVELCGLRSGLTVIDTAAGGGLVAFRAATAVGPDGGVLATDLSQNMVSLGNAQALRLGLTNVTFRRMNAEALECPDDSFDRALCSLGLMYMPDPQSALAELRRVVRPGGRAAVAVWGERRNCGWAEIFPIVDARVRSEVCPLFFGLGSPGALISQLRAVGFRDVEEQRSHALLSFASEEHVLSALIDGGAVALAAKRFDEPTRREVDEAFLASVSRYRVGGGFEIPGEFVIAAGVA